MQVTRLLLPTAMVLASVLAGQNERTLPSQFTDTWGGNNGTGTVFGGTKGISQNLYIAPIAANSLVSGCGFRRTATATDYTGLKLDFEVVVWSTAITLASLSATFASNHGPNMSTVYPRQMLDVSARLANSSPRDWVRIPFTAPWMFQGPNLMLQCKAFGATWTSTGWRADRVFERAAAGDAISFGRACGTAVHSSTSTGSYLPGSTTNLTLSGAQAAKPALLFLGFTMAAYRALILPLDLGLFGMPGCFLNVAGDLLVATVTDAQGAAQVALPIPNDTNLSLGSFGTQFFYFDSNANNVLGALTSNARLVVIGPIVAPNRYVWDLFDETMATGSLQAGGPILMLRSLP